MIALKDILLKRQRNLINDINTWFYLEKNCIGNLADEGHLIAQFPLSIDHNRFFILRYPRKVLLIYFSKDKELLKYLKACNFETKKTTF